MFFYVWLFFPLSSMFMRFTNITVCLFLLLHTTILYEYPIDYPLCCWKTAHIWGES